MLWSSFRPESIISQCSLTGQRQRCRRQDGDLDPHPLRSESRRWLPLALRRPVDASALRCRASVLCAHFPPGSGLPLVCTPSRPWRTCRSGLPAGKSQQLSDPFGGSLRYFGLSVMGSPWGPKTWCAHFLAHRPFGWGPGTFAFVNWSPENGRSRRGVHTRRPSVHVHTRSGPDHGDELPRFCSSGRGCRGRESGLGTQLGSPATLRVCTLGCLWCAHSVLAVFGTLAWTFAFFRLSSLSDASRMPDQGDLAVAVGDNTRRLVFYPSDELAALLAEFSGRFGISRSVLVRRAVRSPVQ